MFIYISSYLFFTVYSAQLQVCECCYTGVTWYILSIWCMRSYFVMCLESNTYIMRSIFLSIVIYAVRVDWTLLPLQCSLQVPVFCMISAFILCNDTDLCYVLLNLCLYYSTELQQWPSTLMASSYSSEIKNKSTVGDFITTMPTTYMYIQYVQKENSYFLLKLFLISTVNCW